MNREPRRLEPGGISGRSPGMSPRLFLALRDHTSMLRSLGAGTGNESRGRQPARSGFAPGLLRRRRLERCESLADAPGERDDLLSLVAAERLLPGGDGVAAASGGLERLGQVTVGVALAGE